MIKDFATFVEYYLPVFIPFLLTILTVLSGILTKRISIEKSNLLKIHNDLVMGLYSFIIWAIVAYQQNGLIKLNDDKEISLIRILLLLFADFIALIIGLILYSYKWDNLKNPLFFKKYKKENVLNGIFSLLTIFLVFLPIFLTDDINKDRLLYGEKNSFEVIVPFLDNSLANHVGITKWEDRLLCKIYVEVADNEAEAIKQSRESFIASGFSKQLFRKDRDVTFDSSKIFIRKKIKN